jgi:hypothetical protein
MNVYVEIWANMCVKKLSLGQPWRLNATELMLLESRYWKLDTLGLQGATIFRNIRRATHTIHRLENTTGLYLYWCDNSRTSPGTHVFTKSV